MAKGAFRTKNAKPTLNFKFSASGRRILDRDVEVSSKGKIGAVDAPGQNGATKNNVRPETFGSDLQKLVT